MSILSKVVTAEEMQRIEKLAIHAGFSEELFMENAGKAVAEYVLEFLKDHPNTGKIYVFAGKGNNGADAFCASIFLARFGLDVEVFHVFDPIECSKLCQQQRKRFEGINGIVHGLDSLENFVFIKNAIILDGLVGTGFKGQASGALLKGIKKINSSNIPCFSIDIPSGLDGTTGIVGSACVNAEITIFLELPKIGFFINQGFNYVGKLKKARFGLEDTFIDQAEASFLLCEEEGIKELLPSILRTRHKYEAGYVIAIAGSSSMPGAAILSCTAAIHSGTGILRLFYRDDAADSLNICPVEIIRQNYSKENFLTESKRASSIMVGPGLGRDNLAFFILNEIFPEINVPIVIDADALYFISENPDLDLPNNSIITPHISEMKRLLANQVKCKSENFLESCQSYADLKKTIVVLKGAPTIIFSPYDLPIFMPYGDPGMATAGSGDVLTGIIASMIAQKLSPKNAAILGVYLHGKSGELAAKQNTSYSMVASDIIAHLPLVFKFLLHSE